MQITQNMLGYYFREVLKYEVFKFKTYLKRNYCVRDSSEKPTAIARTCNGKPDLKGNAQNLGVLLRL